MAAPPKTKSKAPKAPLCERCGTRHYSTQPHAEVAGDSGSLALAPIRTAIEEARSPAELALASAALGERMDAMANYARARFDLSALKSLKVLQEALIGFLQANNAAYEVTLAQTVRLLRRHRDLGVTITASQEAGLLAGPGQPRKEMSHDATFLRLPELGITRSASSRWQEAAVAIDALLEEYVAGLSRENEELATAAGIIRLLRSKGRGDRPVVPLPEGAWQTIVVDPPWPMERIERAERPYQPAVLDYWPLSLEEIEERRPPVAEDGAHVYLWVTHKFLPAGLALFEAWKVHYECVLTWVKPTGMTPFSWMYNTEHVLFGRVGNLPLLRQGLKLSFEASVVRHSEKPEAFYDLVRQASPVGRGLALDMYAREAREDFDAWGNEVKDGEVAGPG